MRAGEHYVSEATGTLDRACVNTRNRPFQLSVNTRLKLLTASTGKRSKVMDHESVDGWKNIKEEFSITTELHPLIKTP